MNSEREQPTYIKINRQYFDSPFWNENRQRTKAEAYIDLFQMATVKKRRYTSSDLKNTIELTRGEGVWSVRFLSKRWHWSRGKVETFLKLLKTRQKIRQFLRQGIMVTFLNDYAESQGEEIYKKDTSQDGVKTGSGQIKECIRKKNKLNTDNEERKIKKKENLQISDFPIPDFVERETWHAYVKMREAIKKPITSEFAAKRILKRLEEFKNQGNDANKIIEQSVISNWVDVYPIQHKGGGTDGQKTVAGKYKNVPVISTEDLQ